MYLYPVEPTYYGVPPYDASWMPASCFASTNFICPAYRNFIKGSYPSSSMVSKSAVELSNTLRELWEQHGAWTRMTIISMVFNSPDAAVVTNRLLRNPVDFGNALKPFYGDEAAAKFSDLLKAHLVIAADLVQAAKAGKSKAAAEAEKKWYANADEIAAFLASINPYWSKEKWQMMLHKHLMLVKEEAVSMLTKKYEAGVKVYDGIERQALEMADEMTKGIISQFPDKFKK